MVLPVWECYVETATNAKARAEHYKYPDDRMAWIYKCNLKIVSAHLYIKPVPAQLTNG